MTKLLLLGLIVSTQNLFGLDHEGKQIIHQRVKYHNSNLQQILDSMKGDVYRIVILDDSPRYIDIFYTRKSGLKSLEEEKLKELAKDIPWIDSDDVENMTAEEIIAKFEKGGNQ